MDALLEGVGCSADLKARFWDLLQADDPLMAASLHPGFRMPIVRAINTTQNGTIRSLPVSFHSLGNFVVSIMTALETGIVILEVLKADPNIKIPEIRSMMLRGLGE